MADSKISALPASTTPLAGTEVLPIVQSSTTKQVSVANLTAGRAVSALSLTSTTTLGVTGVSTLTGGAVIQGLIVGLGANAVATNTAVGVGALGNASGASTQNTAIGYGAMQQVVTGFNSTAVGHAALNALTSGSSNAAIGEGALAANSTGEDNTALGAYSLIANVTGSNNTAIGRSALVSNTGTNNLALGYLAGSSLTTGNNNTIIGSVAGTAGLSDTVIIAAGSVERMRIDSSGNVLVGYTYQVGGAQYNPRIELFGADSSASGIGQFQYGANSSAARYQFNKTRGATADAQAILVNGDELGTIVLSGSDGVGYKRGATIAAVVDGTPGTNSIPGRLIFSTTADGGTTPIERMRIDSSGVVSYTGSLTVSAYTETIVASGTVGASATLAITAGTVLTATLTSATACTFTMPTATAGKSFILLLKQPASGTATTATFTGVKFNSSGAPTITATVGKMDILTFVADGTNWYGSYSQGYTP